MGTLCVHNLLARGFFRGSEYIFWGPNSLANCSLTPIPCGPQFHVGKTPGPFFSSLLRLRYDKRLMVPAQLEVVHSSSLAMKLCGSHSSTGAERQNPWTSYPNIP